MGSCRLTVTRGCCGRRADGRRRRARGNSARTRPHCFLEHRAGNLSSRHNNRHPVGISGKRGWPSCISTLCWLRRSLNQRGPIRMKPKIRFYVLLALIGFTMLFSLSAQTEVMTYQEFKQRISSISIQAGQLTAASTLLSHPEFRALFKSADNYRAPGGAILSRRRASFPKGNCDLCNGKPELRQLCVLHSPYIGYDSERKR